VDRVWKDLDDKDAVVVAQIAPAVRVALGEHFGLEAGESATGKITTALRMLGFDKVYDTSFGADLTVVEEATEFLERKKKGEKLPSFHLLLPRMGQITPNSFFPDFLPNLSFLHVPPEHGGLSRREEEALRPTASRRTSGSFPSCPVRRKKYEISRKELRRGDKPLVDHVLTTTEIAHMIQEAGIRFADCLPPAMDMPLGVLLGAGLIFGNSGGALSEAVAPVRRPRPQTESGIRFSSSFPSRRASGFAVLDLGETKLSVTAVQGLANAKRVVKEIRDGKRATDLVEVMACPGGCIGGAGTAGKLRSGDLQKADRRGFGIPTRVMQLRSTRENPFIERYLQGRPQGRSGRAQVP
jgi:NADH-quinone oxidoreductase subunit G